MLRRDKITAAIAECERFIARANTLLGEVDEHETSSVKQQRYILNPASGTKHASAVRRASMDVTRAMADMRRGDG